MSLATGRDDWRLKALGQCVGFSGLRFGAFADVRVLGAIGRKAQGIRTPEFEIPCASLEHAMAACALGPRHRPLALILIGRHIGRTRTAVTSAERARIDHLLDFLIEFCLSIHTAMDAYLTDATIPPWGMMTGTDPADIAAAGAFSAQDTFFMRTLTRKADEITIAIYKGMSPKTEIFLSGDQTPGESVILMGDFYGPVAPFALAIE